MQPWKVLTTAQHDPGISVALNGTTSTSSAQSDRYLQETIVLRGTSGALFGKLHYQSA